MAANKSEFSDPLTATQTRVASLRQHAKNTLAQPAGLLHNAFQELYTTIEELQVVEEELRAQNEELIRTRAVVEAERLRYQDLFQSAPDSYIVTNLEGMIVEANRAAASLLHIAPRFLKGRMLATSVARDDIREFRLKLLDISRHWESGQHSPQPQEWEVLLQRRNGASFPAALTVAPVAALPNEPPTLRWMIRDISVRKRSEEGRAKAQREQQVATVLDHLAEAFVSLDHDWRFTYLNASARRMCQAAGKPPHALLGKVIWEEFPTSLATDFYKEGRRAADEQKMVEFESYSPGLSLWLHVRVYPTAEGVVAYAQDITERKRAEAERHAAYERERRISETLQNILLRTEPSDAFPSLTVETFYEAASEEALVGGDFFDVFTLENGKVALVVGDVSGKGLAAAALTAEVKYALRAILRDEKEAAHALGRLNDFLCEAQRQGDLGSDHLVVLSLVVLDTDTGRMEFLTGGGEPLLALRASGEIVALETSGLLLGVQPKMSYEAGQMTLAPGDAILLLTDGISEARQEGRLLGFSGVMDLLAQCGSQATLREIGECILEGARAFAGGSLQDDACILLARRRETFN